MPLSMLTLHEDGQCELRLGNLMPLKFANEQSLANWLIQNREMTVHHGIMTEYAVPSEEYSYLVAQSQDDVCKIMQAFVRAGIEFQYRPPEVDGLLVYTLLCKRKDNGRIQNTLENLLD